MADEGTYRSRVAAAALAVFAGGFGAHRFFLGQWWGVFYLLFFWTYIPFLVGVVEGIVFLASGQDSWNRKYNNGVSAGREPVMVVAIFAIALPVIAVLGILAAIAIPAYHDYTIRARTADGLIAASPAKVAIARFFMREQRWPESLDEVGYQPESHPQLGSVRFDPERGLILSINAGRQAQGDVVLVPEPSDGGLAWDCQTVTMPVMYLPSSCR